MATYRATWESGYVIDFRDLTWREYKTICSGVDPEHISMSTVQEIYKTCVLVGPDIRIVTAGLGMFIARHQIINNPFSGDPKAIHNVLNIARETVNTNYLLSAQAMIAHIFRYSIEEINDWPAEKFFLRAAQAEVMVGPKINPVVEETSTKPKPKPKLTARELATKRFLEQNDQPKD